jgi:hypothetical protein
MMTAMLTARNIAAGARRHDVWSVNEDAEYHEAGREGEDAPGDTDGVKAALASERQVPKRVTGRKAA